MPIALAKPRGYSKPNYIGTISHIVHIVRQILSSEAASVSERRGLCSRVSSSIYTVNWWVGVLKGLRLTICGIS